MNTLLLSACPRDQAPLAELARLVTDTADANGYQSLRAIELTGLAFADCQGEFACWIRTPGHCKIADRARSITEAVGQADALILLGPVIFGGHGHIIKRALDRIACPLLCPFFTKRAALTHHRARHSMYPRLLQIGWLEHADPGQRATFEALNDANAINLLAPSRAAGVLHLDDRSAWPDGIRAVLTNANAPGAAIRDRRGLRDELLALAQADNPVSGTAARRAAILIGSPMPKGTCASELMARELARGLAEAGVAVDWHFAIHLAQECEPAQSRARAIAQADLLVLATPLYLDALPAPATRALELIARARAGVTNGARLVVLINCGFPESEQNRVALRICRHFATAAGYVYAGALPLGGGPLVTPERSLDARYGPVAHVGEALRLSAPALARGEPVPAEALDAIIARPIPDGLYRLVGSLRWRWQAWRQGVRQSALCSGSLDPERKTRR